jgi:hypothetical protein
MKAKGSCPMQSRSLLAFLILGLAAVASSGAALNGRVIDGGSAAPLAGAYVTVAGTSRATFTDDQGRYSLANLPPGV